MSPSVGHSNRLSVAKSTIYNFGDRVTSESGTGSYDSYGFSINKRLNYAGDEQVRDTLSSHDDC